jgi:hypothetical protein
VPAITGFNAWSESKPVPADAHGNNVAFLCLTCSGPVLATLHEHQRGSSESKPTECSVCSSAYWVEPQVARNRLLIHRVKTAESGRYVSGREPKHSVAPNVASWSVVSAMLAAYGSAEFEELVAAVRQHDHPEGGRAFINYCIRNGWLRRA